MVTANPARPITRNHGAPRAVLGRVTIELVRLYKHRLGKGPTRATARWTADNALLCVLDDGLLRGERTLIDSGHARLVWEFRRAFRDAIKSDLEHVVATALDSPVLDSIGDFDIASGTATELFFFSAGGRERFDLGRAAVETGAASSRGTEPAGRPATSRA